MKLPIDWLVPFLLALTLAGCGGGGGSATAEDPVVRGVTITLSGKLVRYGLVSATDGLIARDTTTGLEWLRLSATQDQSYDDVVAGFGGFTTVHGFRVASRSEVGQLFQNLGLVDQYLEDPAYVQGAAELMLFLGELADLGSPTRANPQSHGMSLPDQLCCPTSPSVSTYYLVYDHLTATGGRGYVDNGSTDTTSRFNYRGTFLVRNAASPFPPDLAQPTFLAWPAMAIP